MSDLGREIPAGSPEYAWVSSIVASVEKRTGVNTRWNGRLYEEPNSDYLGTAHQDGSMTVSVAKVLDPVRNAYSGRQLSSEELVKVRDAVLTVTHESAHLSSRLGDPSVAGATPLGDDADRALEEGLAESWTHSNVDAVIYDIGMDQRVPAIVGQPNIDAYRAYSAAANATAHGLGTVAQVHPAEIHRVLYTADRTQRWNAAADLIIDQRLDGLMPPEHRASIRQGLTDRMRAEYAKLPAVQGDRNLPGAQKSEAGHTIGRAMVQSVNQAVNDAEHHYRTWSQQQPQPATHQAQQQPQPVTQPQYQQPYYQQPTAQQPQHAQPAVQPQPTPQYQQPQAGQQYQAPQPHQQAQPVPQAQNPQPWQLPQPGQQYQPPAQPTPQAQPHPGQQYQQPSETQYQQPAQTPHYQQPVQAQYQQPAQQGWWQEPAAPAQQQEAGGPPLHAVPSAQATQPQGGQAGWWQWPPEQQRAGQEAGQRGDGEVGKLRRLVGGQRPAAEAVGGQRGDEASGEVPDNVRQFRARGENGRRDHGQAVD